MAIVYRPRPTRLRFQGGKQYEVLKPRTPGYARLDKKFRRLTPYTG